MDNLDTRLRVVFARFLYIYSHSHVLLTLYSSEGSHYGQLITEEWGVTATTLKVKYLHKSSGILLYERDVYFLPFVDLFNYFNMDPGIFISYFGLLFKYYLICFVAEIVPPLTFWELFQLASVLL